MISTGDNNLLFLALYAVFFMLSIAFSLVMNGILLKFTQTLGIRNQNEIGPRWSNTAKPALGGITFFIVFLLAVVISRFFYDIAYFYNIGLLGIFMVLIIAFVLGLFDDAYNTRPLIKLATQILCGLIIVATGNNIQVFSNEILNAVLTVFWVVGIMNSINMLDNMDAITTIVSIIIISLALVFFIAGGKIANPDFFIFVCLLGSLFAFLFFNWHPSKMFMGDTGTMFLGAFLAVLGIAYFWNGQDVYGNYNPLKQAVQVLLLFSLPIIDTTTVFIKRILKGTSPFVGGKDHTTHHLTYIGLSDRQVAIVFALLGIVSATLVYITFRIENFTLIHAGLFILYFIVIFMALFIIALKKPKETDGQATESL